MRRGPIMGLIAAAIIVPIVAYAVGPYFTESTIDEALPTNVVLPAVEDVAVEDVLEAPRLGQDTGIFTPVEDVVVEDVLGDGSMMDEGMMDEGMMDEGMMDEGMMDEGMMDEGMMDEGMMDEGHTDIEISDELTISDTSTSEADLEGTGAVPPEVETQTETGTQATEPVPVTYSGTIVGVNDGIHNAEGKTFVLPLDDGSQILRLEEFYSTNGPDLYVYLSADKRAGDFVSLGKLKANSGNQNYDIPAGTDLEKYDNVLIWCKPFGVLFGSSEIAPDV